jgi:hypothetical protein
VIKIAGKLKLNCGLCLMKLKRAEKVTVLLKQYGRQKKPGSTQSMAKYYLSRLADKDIVNIASYTIQRFGVRQARLYRDGLFKAFEITKEP